MVFDKKFEEKLAKFFAGAFHEVVLPSLDQMQIRIDGIEEKMATKDDLKEVNIRLGKIENRLDKIDDHLERHDEKLDNHEKRISKFETTSSVIR